MNETAMENVNFLVLFLLGALSFASLAIIALIAVLHRDFVQLSSSIDRLITFMERQQAKGL